ncbi:hypothetical protein GCM10009037_23270 [Halarchaeum grantii]|uniref:DUF362 domain-containing protein n=1 Tax=Halarchaeum grantii TaxID=1193105 RepID=A0A830F4Q7_9EURY|nr:DUF362 domain-containing protein [Halarchaeum grantii]GGL38955.1 hypothetical protein GCM10009037_23270 [Halarchaeum grantii]
MVELDVPDADALAAINDVDVADFPRFAFAERHRDPPRVDDVAAATRDAIDAIPALESLDDGADVAVTMGSRGIHDMPELVATAVDELRERGLEPFVLPAMGSHGGATAEGQREVLAEYGVTEDSLGCEIRASMAVESVAEDDEGRPVPASTVALDADAVLLANRVKLHTDFRGDVESGLAKMAVVGLGKQRGAEEMHNAAISRGLETVIRERAALLFEETPVVGGIALLDNARERAARIEGVPADEILDREPELLEASADLFAGLPVDDLDLLVVDELGKDVSGSGMDTNVIGRYRYAGEEEPDTPDIGRIYVRGLTLASHGNAIGMGLADFAHEQLLADVDLADTYTNAATSGEPARVFVPVVTPSDRATLELAYSMLGVKDPADLRIAYIENTLEPDALYVSEPVAADLDARDDTTVGPRVALSFDAAGDFAFGFDDD